MRVAVALSALLVSSASAWMPVAPLKNARIASRTSLNMALDYNDPVVAEEFAKVQPLSYDEVEEELLESGIRAPPTMNDMEVKFMLVEVRMRREGKLGGETQKKERPATFSSDFEEAMWTKPAFEEYYNALKSNDDHNAMNVAAEYVNNPELAEQRYGKDYRKTIREVKAALSAPPPVKSPTIMFSGFPANMGEMGCKMTLEAVGAIAEFECVESDDFPILTGKVTFEDIEDAKKAVEQYNGMDMGMGAALELTSA
mmetsp:Transcript_25999/g.39920  ORF Transcript_25999/g.39920 Transcript_25999/m.39920 type:complete len:256 (+) Transcript_25999:67-834(+)